MVAELNGKKTDEDECSIGYCVGDQMHLVSSYKKIDAANGDQFSVDLSLDIFKEEQSDRVTFTQDLPSVTLDLGEASLQILSVDLDKDGDAAICYQLTTHATLVLGVAFAAEGEDLSHNFGEYQQGEHEETSYVFNFEKGNSITVELVVMALNTSNVEVSSSGYVTVDDNENSEGSADDLPDDSDDWVETLEASPHMDPEVLERLSKSDNWSVRRAVALHEDTPLSIIELLEQDEDADVVSAVKDRALPDDWRSKDVSERIEALKAEHIAGDILELLSQSSDWSLRQAVGWSPSTPEIILERLAEDDDNDVKVAATVDRELPIDWRFLSFAERIDRLQEEKHLDHLPLSALSRSSSSDIRRSVALTPSCPEDILAYLRDDEDDDVKSGVRERNLPDQWKEKDEEERIQSLIDNAPQEVLEILSQSGRWDIRRAVALNSATSEAVLEKLKADPDGEVLFAIVERTLPEAWRLADVDHKVEMLKGNDVPLEVLTVFSSSPNWAIREAVAKNKNSSESILNTLSEDDDLDVQNAAQRALRKHSGGDDSSEAEYHRVYMKTEPAGRVAFGRLDDNLIQLLRTSLEDRELAEELMEIRSDAYSLGFSEAEGVINSGSNGDEGNEGRIKISEHVSRLGPDYDTNTGEYVDGVFGIYMSLTKGSVEFEFLADDGFDEDEFSEVSVEVNVPNAIQHQLYGNPDFNIITSFEFRGNPIDEYDGEIADRGYEDQIIFFSIKNDNVEIIYSNFNGEETWTDGSNL